ncbi:MAG TPA: hypothetical protein VN648_29705, partial [Candidatus Methylomirabilis sp.]|nr:hypothetical protein [Candidatus Methylomirabilis sp.]
VLAGCGAPPSSPAGRISVPVPVSGDTSSPDSNQPILQFIQMTDTHSGWGITSQTGRLLRTADAGETWQDVTPAVEMARDTASAFLDAQTAFIEGFNEDQQSNTNGTLYATHDGGRAWAAYPLPFAGGSLQFLDAMNGYALTVPWGSGTGAATAGILYHTADGGKTWSQMPLRDPSGNPPAGAPPGSISLEQGAALKIQTPGNFWLGGGLITANQSVSLQASRDGGQSWQTQSAGLPLTEDLPPTQMTVSLPVFVDPTNGFFTAAFTLTAVDGSNPRQVMAFFATHDGGKSWAPLPAIVSGVRPSVRADFVSPMDAYIPCGQAVCSTHDGGATWNALPSNVTFDANRVLTRLDFLDPQTGWAVTSAGLFRAIDGGKNWEQVKIAISAPAQQGNLPTPQS